jgi:transcriptional antiterminator RfaH
MVKMGNVYPRIPEEVMKFILGIDSVDTKVKSILPGDLVTINKGPFKGMEALFSHFDGNERAVLLLNILEKTVNGKFNLSVFSLSK